MTDEPIHTDPNSYMKTTQHRLLVIQSQKHALPWMEEVLGKKLDCHFPLVPVLIFCKFTCYNTDSIFIQRIAE